MNLSTPLASAVFVLLTACAPTSGPSSGPEGKLSNNGLVIDLGVLDDLAASRIALEGESSLVDEGAFGALLASLHGEELFSYAIACALDEDQEVRVESTGSVYTGNLGLASDWLGGDCDTSCQRWVSACLLAHTNAFGTSVSISPRGGNPGLSWNPELERSFSYEEGAYYGNLFSEGEERVAVVCAGDGLYQDFIRSEGGTNIDVLGSNFAAGRTHSGGSDDIEFSGLCGGLAIEGVPDNVDVGACNQNSAGYRSGCLLNTDDPLGESGLRRSEVITVFLTSS